VVIGAAVFSKTTMSSVLSQFEPIGDDAERIAA